jgi:hypothetical protein
VLDLCDPSISGSSRVLQVLIAVTLKKLSALAFVIIGVVKEMADVFFVRPFLKGFEGILNMGHPIIHHRIIIII